MDFVCKYHRPQQMVSEKTQGTGCRKVKSGKDFTEYCDCDADLWMCAYIL